MQQFLVRVELTGVDQGEATTQRYARVDDTLALDGFSRSIKGRKARQLPTGTYVAEFARPTHEVAALAIAAVRRSGLEGRVLVVLMLDWAAKGLVALDDDVPSTMRGALEGP
jgi:hypothetical protein